jgi:hypothetical protein
MSSPARPVPFAKPPETAAIAMDRLTFLKATARSSRSAAWQRARAKAMRR